MHIHSKQVMDTFLSIIEHISDVEYQKRIWIRGEGPECDDFVDTVCDFFDVGDPALKDYKNFGITDTQYRLLVQLRDAFETFAEENHFPEEFISSPEWNRIVEMAKGALESFGYRKNSLNIRNNLINRDQILDEFLKDIECLSDKRYQDNIWAANEGPECNDIDDAICNFFDDGNPILENYKDFGITEPNMKR